MVKVESETGLRSFLQSENEYICSRTNPELEFLEGFEWQDYKPAN